MGNRVGETVYYNFKLWTDADDGTPFTGAVLADLGNLSFKLNGSTDKSSLLTLTEIGSTGEYFLTYVPDVLGHYSLIYDEPSGSLGYHVREAWDVLNAEAGVEVITTLYDTVVSMVQGPAPLASGDINESIQSAIVVFSNLDPVLATATGTGDDTTREYAVTVFSSWVEGFSSIHTIEWPIQQVPRTLLHEGDDWDWVRIGSTRILTMQYAPASGDVGYITYTTLHAVDGSDLTEWDKKRVSYLAAGFCLEKMAAHWLREGNAALGAALADFRSRSDQAAARARDYIGLFYSFFGGNGKDLSAGSVPVLVRTTINVERPSKDFRPRLTHQD